MLGSHHLEKRVQKDSVAKFRPGGRVLGSWSSVCLDVAEGGEGLSLVQPSVDWPQALLPVCTLMCRSVLSVSA